MPPYVQSKSKVREFYSFCRALAKGHYEFDYSDVVTKIIQRELEGSGALKIIPEKSTLGQIRQLMLESYLFMTYLSDNARRDAGEIGVNYDAMERVVFSTKKQLLGYLGIMIIFGTASVGNFISKHKKIGWTNLVATLTTVVLAYDELKVRRLELNKQFDRLRNLCNKVAQNAAQIEVARQNCKFTLEALEEYFGDALYNPSQDDLSKTWGER